MLNGAPYGGSPVRVAGAGAALSRPWSPGCGLPHRSNYRDRPTARQIPSPGPLTGHRTPLPRNPCLRHS